MFQVTRENANIMQKYLKEQTVSGAIRTKLDIEKKTTNAEGKVQSFNSNNKNDLTSQNLRDALEKHRILIVNRKQDSRTGIIINQHTTDTSSQSKSHQAALDETFKLSPVRGRRTLQIEQQQQVTTANKFNSSPGAATGKTATILVSKSKTKSGLPLVLKTPAN